MQVLGWDEGYLARIGLGDLGVERIGARVRPPGCRVATLDHRAAAELGLDPGTVVATRSIQRQTEEEEMTKDSLEKIRL